MPYSDASGADVGTLVLVYRVTLPTYIPQKLDDQDDNHQGRD